MTYSYTAGTNKISTITDAASATYKARGFNPGGGSGSYAYDVNGNMTTDPYKAMSVQYNHLNLPKLFTWTGGSFNGNSVEILYDAAGTKLKKTVKTGATVNYTQDYIGGIEYRDAVREAIYTAEGRIKYPTPSTTRYEYTIKDHLGNARISYSDLNGNGVVNETNVQSTNEVLQENNYYPFGLNTEGPWMNDAALDNKYQYNGKEWNDDFGLNLNDYGARWYDAATNRWWVVDKLSDDPNQVDKSPFAYAWNNPVGLDDPDGNCPNCLTALAGALIQGGIELGGQLLSGKSIDEVDWADVGVEALKGGLTGSGIGIGASMALEAGSTAIKASLDLSVSGGNQNIFDGSKSLKSAAIDASGDVIAAGVGNKISKVSSAAVESTTKSANIVAKEAKLAQNNFNKVTDGGKNLYGSKATSASQKLSDSKINSQNTFAQKKVTSATNSVVNSTAGKVVGEAMKNKTMESAKKILNIK